MTDVGYRNLVDGILSCAAKDYKRVLRRLEREELEDNERYRLLARKDELELFFRSEWYEALSDADGERLMDRIRRDAAGRR